jgi:predicted dehydrogenase
MAAAKAGKHVLCEKPLASVPADAEDMIACCAANRVLLQTAFPVRFQPAVSRARELIRTGKIGQVLAVKGTNRGKCPGGWFVDPLQSGGGAVMDHTVHVVDLLRWIMDAEVSEVYVEADRLLTDAAIDDCGIISMQFTNGVFATLDCSWSRNERYPTWGDVTVDFIGSDGVLSVNAFNQSLSVYSNERGCEWSYWGDSMDELLLRDFAASIREGKRTASVTGEDGLRALEVAVASYRSAQDRQPVVLLP